MKQGINLSLGRKRTDNTLKKLFYISVGVFCFTVVISLVLIVYRLVLKNSYDTLDAKEQQLNAQLLSQQDKKDKLIETKSRIVDIKKVISQRTPMTTRIDTVTSVIPADSQVDAINGSNLDMQVVLESDNLASLNDLIEEKITSLASEKKRGIKKIEMRGFVLNPKTLKYTVSLGVTFI